MAIFEFFATHHLAIMIICLSVAAVMAAAGVIVIRANQQRDSDSAAVESKRHRAREAGVSFIRIGVVLAIVLGFLYLVPPAVYWLIEGQ